jgi:hypothetical protein
MTLTAIGAVSDVKWRQRSMDCVATRLKSRMDFRSGAFDSLYRHLFTDINIY